MTKEKISVEKLKKADYDLVINFLEKHGMSKTNFINNCKKIEIHKLSNNKLHIINGYNPMTNVITCNKTNDLMRELIHAASSNKSMEQGITLKPNRVYKQKMGYGLNEGITDLFYEYISGNNGIFIFEKICAKVLEYAYGMNIYNSYFMSDDITFRNQFKNSIINLFTYLDNYSNTRLNLYIDKINHKGISTARKNAVKALIELTTDELLKFVSDSNKDCKTYLNTLLTDDVVSEILCQK